MFQQTSRLNSGGGTTLLKHLKISQRLALVVAMPLVLLVGLAAYMVEAAWAERQEMEVLGEFVGDVAKISRFSVIADRGRPTRDFPKQQGSADALRATGSAQTYR